MQRGEPTQEVGEIGALQEGVSSSIRSAESTQAPPQFLNGSEFVRACRLVNSSTQKANIEYTISEILKASQFIAKDQVRGAEIQRVNKLLGREGVVLRVGNTPLPSTIATALVENSHDIVTLFINAIIKAPLGVLSFPAKASIFSQFGPALEMAIKKNHYAAVENFLAAIVNAADLNVENKIRLIGAVLINDQLRVEPLMLIALKGDIKMVETIAQVILAAESLDPATKGQLLSMRNSRQGSEAGFEVTYQGQHEKIVALLMQIIKTDKIPSDEKLDLLLTLCRDADIFNTIAREKGSAVLSKFVNELIRIDTQNFPGKWGLCREVLSSLIHYASDFNDVTRPCILTYIEAVLADQASNPIDPLEEGNRALFTITDNTTLGLISGSLFSLYINHPGLNHPGFSPLPLDAAKLEQIFSLVIESQFLSNKIELIHTMSAQLGKDKAQLKIFASVIANSRFDDATKIAILGRAFANMVQPADRNVFLESLLEANIPNKLKEYVLAEIFHREGGGLRLNSVLIGYYSTSKAKLWVKQAVADNNFSALLDYAKLMLRQRFILGDELGNTLKKIALQYLHNFNAQDIDLNRLLCAIGFAYDSTGLKQHELHISIALSMRNGRLENVLNSKLNPPVTAVDEVLKLIYRSLDNTKTPLAKLIENAYKRAGFDPASLQSVRAGVQNRERKEGWVPNLELLLQENLPALRAPAGVSQTQQDGVGTSAASSASEARAATAMFRVMASKADNVEITWATLKKIGAGYQSGFLSSHPNHEIIAQAMKNGVLEDVLRNQMRVDPKLALMLIYMALDNTKTQLAKSIEQAFTNAGMEVAELIEAREHRFKLEKNMSLALKVVMQKNFELYTSKGVEASVLPVQEEENTSLSVEVSASNTGEMTGLDEWEIVDSEEASAATVAGARVSPVQKEEGASTKVGGPSSRAANPSSLAFALAARRDQKHIQRTQKEQEDSIDDNAL